MFLRPPLNGFVGYATDATTREPTEFDLSLIFLVIIAQTFKQNIQLTLRFDRFKTENKVKLKGNTQNKVQPIKWLCGLYDGCNDQRAYWIWLTAIILQACLCVFSPLKIEIWQPGESKTDNHVSIYCYIFLVLWSSWIFR